MVSKGFGLKTWLAESYWNGVGALAGIAAVMVALMVGVMALKHQKAEPNVVITVPERGPSSSRETHNDIIPTPDMSFKEQDICCVDVNSYFRSNPEGLNSEGVIFPNAALVLREVGNLIREAYITRNPSSLSQALDHVGRALRETDRHAAPDLWARLQGSRGYALYTMGMFTRDPVRFEEAVKAYRLVLDEWTRPQEPLGRAMTQEYVGDALLMLGSMRRDPRSIEQGITALTAASIVYQDFKMLGHVSRAQMKIEAARRTLHTLSANRWSSFLFGND